MDQSPKLGSQSDSDELDALIQRTQSGDLTAFNSLVLRFQDPIYSLALRMLGSPQAAEDAAQEAFIRAWRRIDSFKGGRFQSWLFTIVANLSRDELRRRVRRPQTSLEAARDDPDRASLDPVDASPSPETTALTGDLRDVLQRALQQLPEEWREIVVLSDVHDLAYDEIARITDLPLGTVKSRLSRARGRLRDILSQSGELETVPDRSEVRR
jgi:RNA polymerase sigma-70 factor (ECF subfamily)